MTQEVNNDRSIRSAQFVYPATRGDDGYGGCSSSCDLPEQLPAPGDFHPLDSQVVPPDPQSRGIRELLAHVLLDVGRREGPAEAHFGSAAGSPASGRQTT
jgi:hypothetical protein